MIVQPAADELEITLLGRGVGECVVVHLGDGEWMVVDSYQLGGEPAARTYLTSMGVDPAAVKVLIVTHFHADHYRGMDLLHDWCNSARLMVTRALRSETFYTLYADDPDSTKFAGLQSAMLRAKNRSVAPMTPGLRDLKAGQIVHDGAVRAVALSPTEHAVTVSCEEIAAAIAARDRPDVTSRLMKDNRCSVALHLEAGASAVLLGADLEDDPAGFGWQAVLNEPDHKHLTPCNLLKVPHHGSDTSVGWDALVEDHPWMLVAPYWSSALPKPTDVARLRSRARALYQAAPSVGFDEDEFGNSVSRPAETGIVQARRRFTETDWTIEALPPAFLHG